MASGQDRGASQFTGEPESQVRNLLCFLSSLSCTFALLYLLKCFYNNADLWINYDGCPQEHFIAQRLFLYCPGVLMEFAVMIQLTLYCLKFLWEIKNRWDNCWHTIREDTYKINVDSITQIIEFWFQTLANPSLWDCWDLIWNFRRDMTLPGVFCSICSPLLRPLKSYLFHASIEKKVIFSSFKLSVIHSLINSWQRSRKNTFLQLCTEL